MGLSTEKKVLYGICAGVLALSGVGVIIINFLTNYTSKNRENTYNAVLWNFELSNKEEMLSRLPNLSFRRRIFFKRRFNNCINEINEFFKLKKLDESYLKVEVKKIIKWFSLLTFIEIWN